MPNSKCRESFFKLTLLNILIVIALICTVLLCYNKEVQAAEAITWTKQDGVLSWYKKGTINKYAPVDAQPSDIPTGYVKQAGDYNRCISTNGARRYVLSTNDCYNKPLTKEVLYCPVTFCIKRTDGTMAITLPPSTYDTCDKLYFDKMKLVSAFDSTVESVLDCK